MKIPKGSYFYDGTKFMAKTVKEFLSGYIPNGTDFEPNLKTGTKIGLGIYIYLGNVIYIHPYFLKKKSDIYLFKSDINLIDIIDKVIEDYDKRIKDEHLPNNIHFKRD
jgi:hypothetical protein